MKNIKLLLGLLLSLASFSLSAQTTGFNYQAVIRDAAFAPLGNQFGTAQVSIFNAGLEVYRESHNISTDPVGLFNLIIGRGTPIVGNFGTINWGSGNRFVQVSVTISGTLYNFAQSELQAVPYAKVAESTLMPGPTGATGPPGATGPQGPTGLTGATGPQGPAGSTGATGPAGATGPQGTDGSTGATGPAGATGPQGPAGVPGPTYSGGAGINVTGTVISNTGDLSSTNEIQTLSISGDVISLSNGGGSINLPPNSGTDAQTLSLLGNDLSISNGNTVTLPAGPAGPAGPQGPTGTTGATGATGPQGPIGLTGATGAAGPTGATGATGPQGPAGVPGPTYSAGTGISIVGTVINNTGDTDPSNDLTTASVAAGDVTGLFSNLQIAANAVGTNEIANASITAADLAPGVIPAALWTATGNDISNTNTGFVGVGTSSPGAKLSVYSDNSGTEFDVRRYGNFTAARFGRANGTIAAPTAINNGNRLSILLFNGYDGTDFRNGASIEANATENWGTGAKGTELVFATNSNGSSILTPRVTINHKGAVGFGASPLVGNSNRIQLFSDPSGFPFSDLGMVGGGFVNMYDAIGNNMVDMGIIDVAGSDERLHIHNIASGGIELIASGGDIALSTNGISPIVQVQEAGEVLIKRTFPADDATLFVESQNGYAGLFNNTKPVGAGFGDGIRTYSDDDDGSAAIYAVNTVATSFAGDFVGNVRISGSIAKGSGTFEIDHPLDPANKYLYHSFVESPDMLNIYNGNASTDANGFATIALPSYFEAENMDFKYQLTCIGQFAQAIVKEEVAGNKFIIQTDKPNVKVSWQVTGVRNDAFARAHRVVPEVEKKSCEKGKYLYPELFGAREEDRIGYRPKPAKEKGQEKPSGLHHCSKDRVLDAKAPATSPEVGRKQRQ